MTLGQLESGLSSRKSLDIALVYYDQLNIGNGRYLMGCPLNLRVVPCWFLEKGRPLILRGPESEPFAKLDTTITEARNSPVFTFPN